MTLEEYRGDGRRAERLRAWPEELVVLSAADAGSLLAELTALRARLDEGVSPARIAYECATSFDAGAPARVALVAADAQELSRKASTAADALEAGAASEVADPDVSIGLGAPREGRLAFLFPGQGSQYVGMGASAAMAFDAARAVWDRAADLDAFGGEPLDRVTFPPPAFSAEAREEQQTAPHRDAQRAARDRGREPGISRPAAGAGAPARRGGGALLRRGERAGRRRPPR